MCENVFSFISVSILAAKYAATPAYAGVVQLSDVLSAPIFIFCT